MMVREQVPLSDLTTFRIGGPAQYLIDCETESDIREALLFAKEKQLPWRVIGAGSNILAADQGYAGVLIRPQMDRRSVTDEGDTVLVVAEAGMLWDALVAAAVESGLWGIENLAGIPGTVGAAPIQNIGAYGTELAHTLEWVEAIDPESAGVVRLGNEACAFGYRDSRFKREPFIIIRIALRLAKQGAPLLTYTDLARSVAAGEAPSTPLEVATLVRSIRARKFPDLQKEGTAGSFFKNPIIAESAYAVLKQRYPEMPGFPGKAGVKIPLAWILDRVLALRGVSDGPVRLFEAQPLVIVAHAGATAETVTKLARDVAARVKEATQIELEWEVRTLP